MILNFSELEEIKFLLDRVIDLEPDRERELASFRDGINIRPSLVDDIRGYLEAAIVTRGWDWEPLGTGVCVFSDEGQSIAVPGPDSPRSLTHALLSAYVGALEAVED